MGSRYLGDANEADPPWKVGSIHGFMELTMSDHGDRGGQNSEMKLVCCKSWGFGTHPNGGVSFRGVNPPHRSLKWHKVSFAHLSCAGYASKSRAKLTCDPRLLI